MTSRAGIVFDARPVGELYLYERFCDLIGDRFAASQLVQAK
jgi:hypothetical protein